MTVITMEYPESPAAFVEIQSHEIHLLEVVGKGSFGTVRRGRWRNRDVAVKIIETEQERQAFNMEVRQLSRVDHPNIVKLYGACNHPVVCLVMEYAEGGSLYNVLHCNKNAEYTVAHAISWTLQCASGVAFLHNLKPHALIHRDLKPPNLLLVRGGTMLKICDFGTACDLHTVMTNNKGSAAWMAPEVFATSSYSEKCDVFSWGIILWEVLTRRKPFAEVGGSAFCILWAVHSGKRPSLIKDCPKPLEELMTRCWAIQPNERPSMSEIESKMKALSQFFPGAEQPIICPPVEVKETAGESLEGMTNELQPNFQPGAPVTGGGDTVVPQVPTMVRTRSSCPSLLASVHESAARTAEEKGKEEKRRSADLTTITEKSTSKSFGHRRTGSCGTPFTRSSENPPAEPKRTSSDEKLHTTSTSNPSLLMELPPLMEKNASPTVEKVFDLPQLNAYQLLEARLQPLPPEPSCPESVEIFKNHKLMAQEYLMVQMEITLLLQRKGQLMQEFGLQKKISSEEAYFQEFQYLKQEKDSLMQLRQSLKKQLDAIKSKNEVPNPPNSDEWVMV